MIQIGREDNKMVNVQLSNEKLLTGVPNGCGNAKAQDYEKAKPVA
jgi:hypothetical protein